jgi:hypothetical protein
VRILDNNKASKNGHRTSDINFGAPGLRYHVPYTSSEASEAAKVSIIITVAAECQSKACLIGSAQPRHRRYLRVLRREAHSLAAPRRGNAKAQGRLLYLQPVMPCICHVASIRQTERPIPTQRRDKRKKRSNEREPRRPPPHRRFTLALGRARWQPDRQTARVQVATIRAEGGVVTDQCGDLYDCAATLAAAPRGQ